MEDYLTEEKMQELSRYYDSDSGLMKDTMETLEETNVIIMIISYLIYQVIMLIVFVKEHVVMKL